MSQIKGLVLLHMPATVRFRNFQFDGMYERRCAARKFPIIALPKRIRAVHNKLFAHPDHAVGARELMVERIEAQQELVFAHRPIVRLEDVLRQGARGPKSELEF